LKKHPVEHNASDSSVLESAFDEAKPSELTALGAQFVMYTMNEVVPRFGKSTDE